jgi:hypothetical protein
VEFEEPTMPVGPYDTFDECVAANQDKDDPGAFCAYLKEQSGDVGADEEAFALQPGDVRVGSFVEWDWQDGTAQGQIERIVTEGQLEVPGTDTVINADEDNPAALIESWREVNLAEGTFYEPTGSMVGRRFASLRSIEALEERPASASVSRAARGSFETVDEDEIGMLDLSTMQADDRVRWEGVIAVEATMTGDGRMFEAGALRWETLPVPLRWAREDEGEHLGAVVVGRIDEVYRDGNNIMARGVFDQGSPEGIEAARQVREGLTPGISVDLDDVSFEIRVRESALFGADEPEIEVDASGMATVMRIESGDEVMITTDARLRAATIVATPAFAEARILLVEAGVDFVMDEDEERLYSFSPASDDRKPTDGMAQEAQRALDWRAEGHSGGEDNTVERARSIANREALSADTVRRMHNFFSRNARYPSEQGFSPGDDGYPSPARVAWGLWGGDAGATWSSTLVERMNREEGSMIAAAAPVRLLAHFFSDPKLGGPTPITVTDDGRVFGHLATWGTCHTGFVGECVQPPASASNYAYFRTGSVRTAEGSEVAVGRLTLDTTHAGRRLGATDTAAHYEHTGIAVADVSAGEDPYGIWVSGALRPGVSDEQVRTLLASPLSGDWRRIGGQLELVAALAVNSPGFPIPRVLVAGGSVQTLQASGVVAVMPEQVEDLRVSDDEVLLARLIERERAAVRDQRKQALAARNRLRAAVAQAKFRRVMKG